MSPETIAFPDGLPVRAFVRCVEQYPHHWHDTLEIIQVLKVSVSINLGNENLLLHENDNYNKLNTTIKSILNCFTANSAWGIPAGITMVSPFSTLNFSSPIVISA